MARCGPLGSLPGILKAHKGFGLSLIKLNQRIKLSTYYLTQLTIEEVLVDRLN